MSFRKMSVYLVIFLCLLSIYYDLTDQHPKRETEQVQPMEQIDKIQAVPMVIKPGESVLSVTEQLNSHIDHLNIEQILRDFKRLNPEADPLNIQINDIYYFPLY